jgi:hypothetical protein
LNSLALSSCNFKTEASQCLAGIVRSQKQNARLRFVKRSREITGQNNVLGRRAQTAHEKAKARRCRAL